jgi:hypothetical protein
MAKKSYFSTQKDPKTSPVDRTAKPGDLNGDGKVDWVDSLLEIVEFIQTPRGQTFIVIAAAAFSAAINIGSYNKTTAFLLGYLHAEWLLPFCLAVGFPDLGRVPSRRSPPPHRLLGLRDQSTNHEFPARGRGDD